jgi:hypothetical protein
MDRFDVLKDLISFSRPVTELAENLSKFDWDYDGEPFIIRASQMRSILERFLEGELTAKELEDWANLLEGREDLDFETEKHDAIENIIYCLANPTLQGEITARSCKTLLGTL